MQGTKQKKKFGMTDRGVIGASGRFWKDGLDG